MALAISDGSFWPAVVDKGARSAAGTLAVAFAMATGLGSTAFGASLGGLDSSPSSYLAMQTGPADYPKRKGGFGTPFIGIGLTAKLNPARSGIPVYLGYPYGTASCIGFNLLGRRQLALSVSNAHFDLPFGTSFQWRSRVQVYGQRWQVHPAGFFWHQTYTPESGAQTWLLAPNTWVRFRIKVKGRGLYRPEIITFWDTGTNTSGEWCYFA